MQFISCPECGAALAGASRCPMCGARNVTREAPAPVVLQTSYEPETTEAGSETENDAGGRTCPKCGNDVQFVDEFVAWYCDYCKKYV